MTSDGEDSDVEPPPTKRQKQNAKKSKINVKWQKQYMQAQTFSSFDQDKNAQAVFLENQELVELTMQTLFEKVVSPLIELLLHETSEYDNRDKNKPQFKVTLEELKNFIGLTFLSGYNIRLAEQDYWGVDPDLRCDTFCETMNGNRFFEIKLFLHAADNRSLSKSRMVKVEPLCDLLNKNIQQFGTAHDDISIDESMVLYYGCHSCKQFIPAKPIRFAQQTFAGLQDMS